MNLQTLKIIVGFSSVLGFVGLCVPSISNAATWFCFFIAFTLKCIIGLRTGEVKSTLGIGHIGFSYRWDETPAFFLWQMIMLGGLAIICGFLFLSSL